MRLAFQDGYAYVPGTYHPGLYTRGMRGIGQDSTYDVGGTPNYAQEAWDSGLGQSDPSSNLMSFASTLPSSALTGASTALMLGGGTTADIVGGAQAGLMAAAPFTGPAAPFVLTAASLIGPIASMFKGCGVTCKEATTIANNAQQAADALFAQWNSTPVKYKSIQQAALAGMADIWKYISGSCQKIGGQGGQQCIADRQRGGKYDFFVHYVDPIANATNIVPDPVDTSTVTGKLSAALSGIGIPMPLLLGGAGLLVLLLATGDSKQ